MSESVIIAENLGKKYRIAHHQQRERYATLRDVLAQKAKGLFQRFSRPGSDSPSTSAKLEDFWALKDISFEIKQGEAVGIIGRNGAGKSTLLKILSRITEPTTGRVRIRKSVASLLEVGTGFHPELTGRENIYLNGAILGMTKAELRRKFDEIVAFAEVENFLDLPVKRYSSGMYVRLAFAVAAHLEPEILIVDEVLAVGDVQFQEKCLGKMGEISKRGRTVLFVSHNMAAVQRLCQRGLLLASGRVETIGSIGEVVSGYLIARTRYSGLPLEVREDRQTDGRGRLLELTLNGQPPGAEPAICCGTEGVFFLRYRVSTPIADPFFSLAICDDQGSQILYMNTRMAGFPLGLIKADGAIECRIPKFPLVPGRYFVNATLWGDGRFVDKVEGAMRIQVNLGPFFASADTSGYSDGRFLVDHIWSWVSGNAQSQEGV